MRLRVLMDDKIKPITQQQNEYDDFYNDLLNITPSENTEQTSTAPTKFTYRSFLTVHPKLAANYKTPKITDPVGKSILITNLTWWTTDEDLMEAAAHCNVKDILVIKFAENRINGLSKGCALIEVESETSYDSIIEKFPLLLIHGSVPQIVQNSQTSSAQTAQMTQDGKNKENASYSNLENIKSELEESPKYFEEKIPKPELECVKKDRDEKASKTEKYSRKGKKSRSRSRSRSKSLKNYSRARRRTRSRSPSHSQNNRNRHRKR